MTRTSRTNRVQLSRHLSIAARRRGDRGCNSRQTHPAVSGTELLDLLMFGLIRVDPRKSVAKKFSRARAPAPHSHAVVVRPAAALGRHPCDDLVRVGNI